MAVRYAVLMVARVKPDTFAIVGMDLIAGQIKETSEFMEEDEMRKYLEDHDVPNDEINRQIARARSDPK